MSLIVTLLWGCGGYSTSTVNLNASSNWSWWVWYLTSSLTTIATSNYSPPDRDSCSPQSKTSGSFCWGWSRIQIFRKSICVSKDPSSCSKPSWPIKFSPSFGAGCYPWRPLGVHASTNRLENHWIPFGFPTPTCHNLSDSSVWHCWSDAWINSDSCWHCSRWTPHSIVADIPPLIVWNVISHTWTSEHWRHDHTSHRFGNQIFANWSDKYPSRKSTPTPLQSLLICDIQVVTSPSTWLTYSSMISVVAVHVVPWTHSAPWKSIGPYSRWIFGIRNPAP